MSGPLRLSRFDAPARVERVPFDDFLSESNDDAFTNIDASASPKPLRQAHGFQILSDADAFLSEIAACESDRAANRNDVDAVPVDGGFLSEDEGLPSLHAEAIDDPLPAVAFASESGAEHPDGVVPPAQWSGGRVLSRAVSLVALSASLFVAVVLFTEVLDLVKEALFTRGGLQPMERPVDAGTPGAVMPDVAPFAARPLLTLARFKSGTPAVVAHTTASLAESPVLAPAPLAAPNEMDKIGGVLKLTIGGSSRTSTRA